MIITRPKLYFIIVSSIPGTTRDVIETRLDFHGYPIVISDTAGLRTNVQDIVEEEGVKRAVEAANDADICVFVQDSLEESVNFETFGLENRGQVCLQLINKSDLLPPDTVIVKDYLAISALSGQGMEAMIAALLKLVQDLCGTAVLGSPGLTRQRHRLHLQRAIDHLEEYLSQEIEGADLVICAHQLRKAVREIGFVSGRVSSNQILDVIFADFCIGK